MKKYLLSFSLLVVFAIYIVLTGQDQTNVAPLAVNSGASQGAPTTNPNTSTPPATTTGASAPIADTTPKPTSGSTSKPKPTPAPAPAPAPTPAPAPVPASTGKYKNGTYQGDVTDAFYGPMQVAAVIKGGQISDVQLLQYPSGSGHSDYVNSQALPILVQETIQNQSAQIDAVSGATASSQAFIQSLSSALAKAV